MKEYIEREAAEELLSQPITMSMCLTREECLAKRSQRDIDVAILHSIPAADVRPVVTCIECKHSCDMPGGLRCCHGTCVDCYVDPEFFCSDGEKMEES